MNLVASRVVLRARPLADVLDLAVPFCLASRRTLATVGVLTLLPGPLVAIAAHHHGGWSWLAIWFFALLWGDFVEGLFTVAFGELLFHEDRAVRTRDVWRRFGRRLGSYLATYLVSRLLLALAGLTVLLLPSTAMRLLFVREASLLEGAGLGSALGRSFRFVARRGLACLGLLLALALVPVVSVIGAELIGQAVVTFTLQMGTPFGDLFKEGGSLFALVGFFLSVPVSAAARFLGYTDIRTRKEGWDIQLRFTAIIAAEQAERNRAA